MKTRPYLMSEVLTISTGVMLCHVGGLYSILGFMTQDHLMTHQLVPAGYIMEDEIKRQHPWLSDIEPPQGITTQEECDEWVDRYVKKYGEHLTVTSAEHLWIGHGPFKDLKDIKEGKYSNG